MNRDRTTTHTGAPGFVGEVHTAQSRMAYRFAWQYGDKFRYIHSRGTAFGWISWNGTAHTLDDPGAPTKAVLDVLRRAVAESPDDEWLRADVTVCSSEEGVAAVLALASQLEPFAVRPRRAGFTTKVRR